MLVDELLGYLFDGKPHLLTTEMAIWLGASRRFTAFAMTFREKIRKKLRTTRDRETLYDLRLELETAFLLLQERTFSLVYESETSRQVRSPDFAVTYTTSLTFMVEVTRLRAVQKTESASPDIAVSAEQLADTIYRKLGQFLRGRSNILIIGVDSRTLTQSDLQAAMLQLQQRAEPRESTLWHRYRFRDRADFFQQYHLLSEVLVRGSTLQTANPVAFWANPQAKFPLPARVRTALYHSHTLTA
jgi:hypothetical protein